MNKVRKAVIPVGGYGTRFLPMSKSVPKEMLPVGNKPVILHVVEECVASGITDIIFVVSHHKHSIETFFSPSPMMEDYYERLGKTDKVAEMKRITTLANYSFVFTNFPNGNGGALKAAKHLVGDEPFALLWGDELMTCPGKPRLQQCIETFEKFGQPVISAIKITDKKKIPLYGMAELKAFGDESYVKQIVRIVEKPTVEEAPSVYAAHGAYILTPEIFEIFNQVKSKDGVEVFLTDLINIMKRKTGLLARIIKDAAYLDCGVPDCYLNSQIEYALMHADTRKALVPEIKKLLKKYT